MSPLDTLLDYILQVSSSFGTALDRPHKILSQNSDANAAIASEGELEMLFVSF